MQASRGLEPGDCGYARDSYSKHSLIGWKFSFLYVLGCLVGIGVIFEGKRLSIISRSSICLPEREVSTVSRFGSVLALSELSISINISIGLIHIEHSERVVVHCAKLLSSLLHPCSRAPLLPCSGCRAAQHRPSPCTLYRDLP